MRFNNIFGVALVAGQVVTAMSITPRQETGDVEEAGATVPEVAKVGTGAETGTEAQGAAEEEGAEEEEEVEDPAAVEDEVDTPEEAAADSNELLGNLLTLTDDQLTPDAKLIKEILLGGEARTNEQYPNVPQLFSRACRQDQCCVWKYLADEMARLFRGRSGRCTKWARFAVRAGFHDAGTWEKTMTWGGADGSLAIFNKEKFAGENKGLEDFIDRVRYWYRKYNRWYKFSDVTHADIIQVAASVAVTVCPLGPRMRTFVGRPDGKWANPTSLLPNVRAPGDELVKLFEDKTIRAHGLTALIGAHTTSMQRFAIPEKKNFPQDSTPGVWDTLFYKETLGQTPNKVVVFPSDIELSKHPKTKDEFAEFADPKDGQDHWNEDYAREYVRLSLLGVKDMLKMKDCGKIIPPKIDNFVPKDQYYFDKWLNSVDGSKDAEVCKAVSEGEYTPQSTDKLRQAPRPIRYGDILSAPKPKAPKASKKPAPNRGGHN